MSKDNRDTGRGATWPLGLLFVLTLYGALSALLFPGWLPLEVTGQVPDKSMGLWMLLAALICGIFLYIPRFWAWTEETKVETIGKNVEAAVSAVTTLTTGVKSLQDSVDQLGKDIVKRFDAIDGQLKTQQTALDAIKAKTDTIKP